MRTIVMGKLLNFTIQSAIILVPCLLAYQALAQDCFEYEVRNTNCPVSVSSPEASRWYFGINAGLDFSHQKPMADLTNHYMNTINSPALISDSLSNILFFTNGLKVWNRNGGTMDNGDGLHGNDATMPAIIVPKPGSNDIYYIFTVHRPRQSPDDLLPIYGFEYNEVNLSLDGGLGSITVKNQVLLPPDVSSKLTAVRHSNGVDCWVVVHKFNSSEFCSFLVTPDGVVTTSYESSISGSEHTGPGQTNNAIGYMKISPDGRKIALAIRGLDIFEIFDFNCTTGRVTNAVTSDPVFVGAHGIEFSPDSRFLYGTTLPSDFVVAPSYLFQFDVEKGNDIFNDYITLASSDTENPFSGLQLATDGRIYVSRGRFPNGADTISVIENPKRSGLLANYNDKALSLAGKRSLYGLPNFIQSYFNLPHFNVENVCYADSTVFILQNNSNIDSVLWDFDDPYGTTTDSTYFIFSEPGTYSVKVTEYFQGESFGPYTEMITINPPPLPDIGDTVFMYPGSPILLDAGAGFASYEWSTGENTQVIRISEPGNYWLTVENEKCCFNRDSVVVVYFDVMVPNAFRPGGINDVFKAYVSSEKAIKSFSLYIYNRWGQQVFASRSIETGWDGRFNGKEAPGDIYVWVISYDIEREGKIERIVYKGNMVLIR